MRNSDATGMRLGKILTALSITILAMSLRAQLPHPFDLATLDGTNGVRFGGNVWEDRIGCSVSNVGDVNGDGNEDFLIGSSRANTQAGSSYLVYGSSSVIGSGGYLSLPNVNGTNGIRINGIDSTDESGASVSGLGDVNGDGYDDLIIGAVFADPSGRSNAGESYVLFGSATGVGSGTPLALSSLDGTVGLRLDGIDIDDRAGTCVSGAGDINADGLSDFLIGAQLADPGVTRPSAGETYLVFGSHTLAHPTLLSWLGSDGVQFNGIDDGDRSGISVSGAGDVNGDGYDDLLIGAHYADPNGHIQAGEVYLVYGSTSLNVSFELSALSGTSGLRLDGVAGDDLAGGAVSGAGDINGDGYADILIGALGADPSSESQAGSTYLVYGAPSLTHPIDLGSLNGANGTRLDGIALNDNSGISTAGAGDVNGDGYGDLIIGARGADSKAGECYLVYGSASLSHPIDLSSLNGSTGVRFDGPSTNDQVGESVSGIGDVNGDGFGDLLLGADQYDPNVGPGEAYLIYGVEVSASATYRVHTRAGDAPRRGVGMNGDGSNAIPLSRCWIDYVDGSGPGPGGSSLETVTITRNDTGIAMSPLSQVADVQWQITTDRIGAGSAYAEVTFKYLDSEIAGLTESSLSVYQSTDMMTFAIAEAGLSGGGFTELTTIIDETRNTATASTALLVPVELSVFQDE